MSWFSTILDKCPVMLLVLLQTHGFLTYLICFNPLHLFLLMFKGSPHRIMGASLSWFLSALEIGVKLGEVLLVALSSPLFKLSLFIFN